MVVVLGKEHGLCLSIWKSCSFWPWFNGVNKSDRATCNYNNEWLVTLPFFSLFLFWNVYPFCDYTGAGICICICRHQPDKDSYQLTLSQLTPLHILLRGTEQYYTEWLAVLNFDYSFFLFRNLFLPFSGYTRGSIDIRSRQHRPDMSSHQHTPLPTTG